MRAEFKARQLQIVHLSDLHFGDSHRFRPEAAADGIRPRHAPAPNVCDLLADDLQSLDFDVPTIVCVTGDIANHALTAEFDEAEEFLNKFLTIAPLTKTISKREVFLIPGNHDVTYDKENLGHRWQQWTEFYNRFFGTTLSRDKPVEFANVFDRHEDLGAIIVTLNSTIFVQKGTEEQNRGRIDEDQISRIERLLQRIPEEVVSSSIKIALVHHHPILVPALVEAGRGYDAVHNSGKLLVRLRKYGFHLVLHGHKHLPGTFVDDLTLANQSILEHPIFIASAGSLGSEELPKVANISNTYSRMRIALHPNSGQWRVRHETRALRMFGEDHAELLYDQKKFYGLKVVDKFFYTGATRPPTKNPNIRKFERLQHGEKEANRDQEYLRLRLNMPVVDVYPSLAKGQVYEARLWIVPHNSKRKERVRELPETVVWSAGELFEVVTVNASDDPNFAASLAYYGPMLVQVVMKFRDGYEAVAHIYARLPISYAQ